MPPKSTKSTKKPGCLTRLLRWGIGGFLALIALVVAANLLSPSSPSTPAATERNATIELAATATTVPTDTPEQPPVEVPTTTAPAVELLQATTEAALPADTPASDILAPTAAPIATDTPSLIPPTNTPLPQTAANQSANLRGGPGTDYPIVGAVSAGQALNVVASSPDGQWLQLDNGAWIALFLVDNVQGILPIAANIPEPQAPPTDTPLPVVVEQPTAAPPPAATDTPWVLATVAPQAPSSSCCKMCSKGKACGDSCISADKTCHVGAGCACNAN